MLLSSIIFSCDTEDNINFDVKINLTIENADGIDLLNPLTVGAISKNDIKIFFEINGERKTYQSINSDVTLDNPDGFSIYPPDGSVTFGGKYHLNIISNPTIGNAVTIIEINGRDDIELISEVVEKNGSITIKKIWLNDNLVWPIEGNQDAKYVRVIFE